MTKKTTRTRAEAKKLMWEYYRDNKASLPKWISKFREEVIVGLCNNNDPHDLFSSIVQNENRTST